MEEMLLWFAAALIIQATSVYSEKQPVSTYGGTAKGASCVFPHKYFWTTYNTCHGWRTKQWCCTDAKCGKWGYCNEKRSTWNHLSVRWRKFYDYHMNEKAAVDAGWTLLADNCQDTSGPFHGRRFILKGDFASILIFDVNGHIAGTQMAFKTELNNGEFGKYSGVYQKQGEHYYLTAYFMDPLKVCDVTHKQYSDVVGDRLVFLKGNDEYVNAPLLSDDAAGTKWVRGKCFYTMGTHYWYDVSSGMECNDFFPFFLLYNDKKLNGWGFSTTVGIKSSKVEHPPGRFLKMFFTKPTFPKCLPKLPAISTQHVYFSKIGFRSHLC